MRWLRCSMQLGSGCLCMTTMTGISSFCGVGLRASVPSVLVELIGPFLRLLFVECIESAILVSLQGLSWSCQVFIGTSSEFLMTVEI